MPAFIAVVPAHNESRTIADTVRSLQSQTMRPDSIIVVADNCTDHTVTVAADCGAQVVETIDNDAKKAGALNQALTTALADLAPDDAVLVMDADSVLAPAFLETAHRLLVSDRTIGAVGGIFVGDRGGGVVGHFQRNEFARYAREVARKKGRAMVLSGTATLFRVSVLQQVAAARGSTLPGKAGEFYDTQALTEDNEITLAVKTLGLRAVSPRECVVVTEIMTSWDDLYRQRLRWQRGAIENLRQYGLTRTTLPYVIQQLTMALGLVCMWTYLGLSATLLAMGRLAFSPAWAAIGLIFVAERVVTVWRRGTRARLLAATLLPEIGYDLFQQAVLVSAAVDVIRRRDATWHHPAALEGGR